MPARQNAAPTARTAVERDGTPPASRQKGPVHARKAKCVVITPDGSQAVTGHAGALNTNRVHVELQKLLDTVRPRNDASYIYV